MTWDHLVCAACSGLVRDGSCPTCRAARDRFQREEGEGVSPALLAALAFLIIVVAVLAQRLAA
jgi:hypothetical protein